MSESVCVRCGRSMSEGGGYGQAGYCAECLGIVAFGDRLPELLAELKNLKGEETEFTDAIKMVQQYYPESQGFSKRAVLELLERHKKQFSSRIEQMECDIENMPKDPLEKQK